MLCSSILQKTHLKIQNYDALPYFLDLKLLKIIIIAKNIPGNSKAKQKSIHLNMICYVLY